MVVLETLAVARQVRRQSEPAIDNDQELAAAGLSCVGGALFRAMPSAGGFSQTAINQEAGARTQLSELVTVVLALASALFLGGVLSDLPQATLGSLVVVAVLGLIKPAEFVRFWRLDKLEFWVAVIAAASGLVFGLLVAVAVGVVLTLFLVLVELDRVGVTELQPTEGDADVRAAGGDTAPVPGLLVLRYDGPLYTANVRSANRKVLAALDARPGTRVLVLDASALGRLPVTVIDELLALGPELAGRGVTGWMAALPPDALRTLRTAPRWSELEGEDRFYPTALAAVRAFRSG